MKSNVCKIENGTKDLDAILRESEKVAVYNDLTHKQTLQLRLICEEIDGMLPNIIDDFSGDFWIDFEDGVCKVNVSLRFEEFTAKKKEEKTEKWDELEKSVIASVADDVIVGVKGKRADIIIVKKFA